MDSADALPPPVPSSHRSLSISSTASLHDLQSQQQQPRRDSTRREELAETQHALRLAKAEIAHLQAKLGLKNNAAPFNSSSPRKSSLGGAELPAGPLRKPSLSDLRRRSVTPDPDRRSSTTASPGPSPRSAYFPSPTSANPRESASPRGPIALPEGSGHVAMNRALLSDAVETLSLAVPNGSSSSSSRPPYDDRSPSPTSTSSGLAPSPLLRANGLPSSSNGRSSGGGGGSSENPFFGSGATRERLSKSAASAQSGSGKVITQLQSDLLQARSALEATRGQLRLSQRAVETLGRQTEDLKETKERLSLEIDGLNRQITRKERLQEEALGRARVAEASLATLQTEHRALQTSQKEKIRTLEEAARKAEEAKTKADREYGSLRDGLRTMSEGWRDDLKWLKEDLAKSERELESKASHLTKLLSTRASLDSTVSTTLTALSSTQSDFVKQHASSTQSALKQLKLLSTKNDEDAKRAEELRGEFGRLRRNMAEYKEDEANGAAGGNAAATAEAGGGGPPAVPVA
ncbi:hypothetical protein JCM8097_007716 [Rhodosporidiobolus ruineniae]